MSRYDRINEFREKNIPSGDVLSAADLNRNDIIVDVGAGSGYYSRLFADYVDTVYSVEINPEAVELIRKNSMDKNNIKIINEDICSLDIKNFNKVFYSLVFHDIECKDYIFNFMIGNSKKPLKVILIEFKNNAPMGPPVNIRIEHDRLKKIFENHGFREENYIDLKYNYINTYIMK